MIYHNSDTIRALYEKKLSEFRLGQTCLLVTPEPLFIKGKFNTQNNYSGQDIIRQSIADNGDLDLPASFVNWFKLTIPIGAEDIDPNKIDLGLYEDPETGIVLDFNNPIVLQAHRNHMNPDIGIMAHFCKHDEQSYIAIHLVSPELNLKDSYVLTWFKSRGCTESITKNNEPIKMHEYASLYNILLTGDFFDLTKWKDAETE